LPVWAILVNGYNDVANTFDEDVAGMYSVLRGFGVLNERILLLSPFKPPGNPTWMSASKNNLDIAFSDIQKQMDDCKNDPGISAPHFLLFWSSHGTDKILFCNRADGNQDNVDAGELNALIVSLEDTWKPVCSSSTKLAVTFVVEACQSGSVGQFLHDAEPQRRILASAKVSDTPSSFEPVSYRDIDYDIGTTKDPNPADAGSETIWGYVEAFGSAAADTSGDGKIDFDEAVIYAEQNDVTSLSGDHQIAVWTPIPPDTSPVHGAWNTSERVASDVWFSSPESTQGAAAGSPVTAKVSSGDSVDLDVTVDNPGAQKEQGALALRLFRNDCPGSSSGPTCDEWAPRYYGEDDNLRTTVMIPGLTANQSFVLDFDPFELPSSYGEGETMRFVVTLDSAQKYPAGIMVPASPNSEIVLEVEKKCKSICCWFKNLWK
jgi:hypothetical protein